MIAGREDEKAGGGGEDGGDSVLSLRSTKTRKLGYFENYVNEQTKIWR